MSTTTKSSERRDGPRIDLRLRVRWSAVNETGTVSGEAEASDVSPKGLRLESEHKLVSGSSLDLIVDVGGDADELIAKGTVMWCRERESPTGRQLYDVGVAFESDWLAKDRGPLGQALARIFAMNDFEPARTFERTTVALSVAGAGPLASGALTMVNLSAGGMQLKAQGSTGDIVRAGLSLEVTIASDGVEHRFQGRVAWVAASEGGDRFGVELSALSTEETTFLEGLRTSGGDGATVSLVLHS